MKKPVCIYHGTRKAESACPSCGKLLCESCAEKHGEYCRECAEADELQRDMDWILDDGKVT